VYRIVNLRTGKVLFGATSNLAGVRNRFEFARSNNSPAAIDHRLRADVAANGFDGFELEVLDHLDVPPTMTADQITADLATLESLWREKVDPSLLY
jgi:hypothetical protein